MMMQQMQMMQQAQAGGEIQFPGMDMPLADERSSGATEDASPEAPGEELSSDAPKRSSMQLEPFADPSQEEAHRSAAEEKFKHCDQQKSMLALSIA